MDFDYNNLKNHLKNNSIKDKDELLEKLYGEYLGKNMQLSWEKIQLEEKNSRLINEHENSLALLIENEAQKIQMEKLNQKLSDAYKKLEDESKLDYLTNLLNRKAILNIFEAEFKRIIRERDRFNKILQVLGSSTQFKNYFGNLTCVIIDIDFFKIINDSYGHLIGDQVLKEIAMMLSDKKNIRFSDSTGRFGGEEFLIIMPETSADEAVIPMEKIRKNIQSKIFSYNNCKSFKVTISAGISEYKETDTIIDDIILRADNALYYAKKNGRNIVTLYDSELMYKINEEEIMQDENTITFNLNSSSDDLKSIRDAIKEKLNVYDNDLAEYTAITASELCENAIKYGTDIGINKKMKFELFILNKKIKIVVTNAFNDNNNIKKLQYHIDLINSSSNPSELYINSIKNLLNNQNTKISQLGLFRIASELDFKLSYEVDNSIIKVSAEKNI